MQLRGTGVGRHAAVGPVVRMPAPLPEPGAEPSTADPAVETERTRAALAAVAADLRRRAERAGAESAAIIAAQALMAEDPVLADDVAARIAGGRTGQRAVHEAFLVFRERLTAHGGRSAERAADLRDVAQRVIALLTGAALPRIPDSDVPFVLVADDLAPADTAALDLRQVLALVTREGGPTSHTAILARHHGVPAVLAVAGADDLLDGRTVIVDPVTGEVVADPSEARMSAVRERSDGPTRAAPRRAGAGALADGTLVALLANVGGPADAAEAVRQGAEGIGLLRTEFLYLAAAAAPTAEQQRAAYAAVLAPFRGRPVVARVLDAGADKPLPFLGGAAEPNPAIGVRGLRALRRNEAELRRQLAALAAAARETGADLGVLAPMVAEPAEAAWFAAEVHAAGIAAAGAMIEVPSAALLAAEILAVTDFASIGTNDLTQYTLAADRSLGALAALQDPWHPAVLRLVQRVGAAGAAVGGSVGVCGEAAADPELAVVLVGLGATSLSMAPAALAEVRAELRRVSRATAVAAAAAALATSSAGEARAAARQVRAAVEEAG